MRVAVTILALLFMSSNIYASEFPQASEIIQSEGQFVFTDVAHITCSIRTEHLLLNRLASADARLLASGSCATNAFLSFVDSGRGSTGSVRGMIIAKWKSGCTDLYPPEIVPRLSFVDGGLKVKVYKCYFVIDQLIKIPKPS